MGGDCTAHPFDETNRRARRASQQRAVAETQTAAEKVENNFQQQ